MFKIITALLAAVIFSSSLVLTSVAHDTQVRCAISAATSDVACTDASAETDDSNDASDDAGKKDESKGKDHLMLSALIYAPNLPMCLAFCTARLFESQLIGDELHRPPQA